MTKIKRYICINVPCRACNLKCEYCYITHTKQWNAKNIVFNYDAEHIGKSLSVERLGGVCLVNLTGNGETLLQKEIIEIIKKILEQGHYVEIVTNGTLTKRFKELTQLNSEMLKRIEFKFSFHYLELVRTNQMDIFFDNVKMMKSVGCSFTVECLPNDALIEHIEDIKKICEKELGALCHLTVGRQDTRKDRRILTELPMNDYVKTWSIFNSNMFNFKIDIFGIKRREFCYAGMWSLYVDLRTGDSKPCYGQLVNQNIFEDLDKSIKFRPVGKYCVQPFCYNGHTFLTLGTIPKLTTPQYAQIRNRTSKDGKQWLSKDVKEFFSSRLYETNKELSLTKKLIHTIFTPFEMIPLVFKSRKTIINKISKKLRFEKN